MKKSLKNSKSDVLKLSLTLFVIAGVMAMLVSLVNNITATEIEKQNSKKITDALKSIVIEAENFEEINYQETFVMSDDGKKVGVDGVWRAESEGQTIGYCVKVSPQGYGGEIETIVGINSEGKVIGAEIVSISETTGIGTKIQDESFLSQFVGKYGVITIASSEPAENEIQTISGATKSSKAYLRGINAALTVANKCMEVTAK